MDIRLSVARTALKKPLQKQKRPVKPSIEDIRFWQAVALSLATAILSMIFGALFALLLK